jgi:hypothetical protein
MRIAAPLMLALCVSFVAFAQDEMPKDRGADLTKKTQASPTAQKSMVAGPDDPSAPPPPGTMIDEPMALLQALDKVTARVRRIPVRVGHNADFGTLSIKLDACRKAPPEDAPESAAFLEITDHNSSGAPRMVFSGWMFASSPALSAMDHPVYDISVVDCPSEATAAAASSTSASPSH